jgi:acyl-CoA dehydrogenase
MVIGLVNDLPWRSMDVVDGVCGTGHLTQAIYPQTFSLAHQADTPAAFYLRDPATRKLVEFFEAKGLAALKDEDRREAWYADWVAYQAGHRLYASVLSPREFSSSGNEFDLLRLTRFVEVFAYFSPAHGYSLQVTFLGLFSILMGSNADLKREAVAALEAGGLLALAVSERDHGADLLGNAFALSEVAPGRFVAAGRKYYIGNANAASIISVLARCEKPGSNGRPRRAPPALFALRPGRTDAMGGLRKIRTMGVRAAYVGEFEVAGHELGQSDLIAEGRDAWDAVAGAVSLGKFFLGFGSIGICEHALAEAAEHLGRRVLFGRAVLTMPHIRAAMAEAYARLTAMKLYAYRALDYVRAAAESDRRYLLFAAVQKAKVGIEGVRVMSLLSECVGAKGFEADTYIEMALRDAPLIPRLEGSTHINLAQVAQFVPRYFGRSDVRLVEPGSLVAGDAAAGENPYLMEARTGAIHDVAFAHFLRAYRPLRHVANVRRFARQVRALARFVRKAGSTRAEADARMTLALGQCAATAAYGQLVAENAVRLGLGPQMVGVIFHVLVSDLTADALAMAALPGLGAAGRAPIGRLITIPRTKAEDWEWVARRMDRPQVPTGQEERPPGDRVA